MKHLHFHIGRGGRFYNGGHLTFKGEADFAEIQRGRADDLLWIDEDENGNPLPKEQQQLRALCSGEILAQGDEIYAETGRLDFDGEFDTDYVTTPDNLNDDEIRVMWREFFGDADYVLTTLGEFDFNDDFERREIVEIVVKNDLWRWDDYNPQLLGIDDDEAFAYAFYYSGEYSGDRNNRIYLAFKQ